MILRHSIAHSKVFWSLARSLEGTVTTSKKPSLVFASDANLRFGPTTDQSPCNFTDRAIAAGDRDNIARPFQNLMPFFFA